MKDEVWESRYLDAYDKVLANSDIYIAVRDFHVNAMRGCGVVLDSGCGTGNVTVELLKQGKTVHAVDSSRKALEMLRAKCKPYAQRLKVYEMSAEKLPFPDGMFDGVTSMFVAHFMEDFEGYLRESCRVLRKGGVFAITARSSSERSEDVVASYEGSLRKRGLLPKLAPEMALMRETILGQITRIIRHPYTTEDAIRLLKEIGFGTVEEMPNPYFGLQYSLLARK